jgi:hypothetical protein
MIVYGVRRYVSPLSFGNLGPLSRNQERTAHVDTSLVAIFCDCNVRPLLKAFWLNVRTKLPTYLHDCWSTDRLHASHVLHTDGPFRGTRGPRGKSFHLRERDERSNDIPHLAAKSYTPSTIIEPHMSVQPAVEKRSGHKNGSALRTQTSGLFQMEKSRWC